MSTILIVAIYAVIAMIAFGALVYKYENNSDCGTPELLFASIVWPFFLCLGIIGLPFFITYKIATALKKYKNRKKSELTFRQRYEIQ